MTPEEFVEKHGHLTDAELDAVVPVLRQAVVEKAKTITKGEIENAAYGLGAFLSPAQIDLVFDAYRDDRFAEYLEEGLA